MMCNSCKKQEMYCKNQTVGKVWKKKHTGGAVCINRPK